MPIIWPSGPSTEHPSSSVCCFVFHPAGRSTLPVPSGKAYVVTLTAGCGRAARSAARSAAGASARAYMTVTTAPLPSAAPPVRTVPVTGWPSTVAVNDAPPLTGFFWSANAAATFTSPPTVRATTGIVCAIASAAVAAVGRWKKSALPVAVLASTVGASAAAAAPTARPASNGLAGCFASSGLATAAAAGRVTAYVDVPLTTVSVSPARVAVKANSCPPPASNVPVRPAAVAVALHG